MRQVESLNHTRWDCKYHIVFIPKYRKKVLFGQIRKELGEVFHRTAEREFDRGRTSAGGSRAYDDIDSSEIGGLAGGGFYQREECDPHCAGVHWPEKEFCGTG